MPSPPWKICSSLDSFQDLKVRHASKHLPTKSLSSHPFRCKQGTATCEALQLHWQNGCLLRQNPPGDMREAHSRSPAEPGLRWLQRTTKFLGIQHWKMGFQHRFATRIEGEEIPTDLRSIMVIGIPSWWTLVLNYAFFQTSMGRSPKLNGSKTAKTYFPW